MGELKEVTNFLSKIEKSKLHSGVADNNITFSTPVEHFYGPTDNSINLNPYMYNMDDRSWYDNMFASTMKAFNQTQIATSTEDNREVENNIDNYNSALHTLKRLPVQTDYVRQQIADIELKKQQYVTDTQGRIAANNEDIAADNEDIAGYKTDVKYDLISAYMNENSPDERSVGESFYYTSPNAIGSSLSFMGSQIGAALTIEAGKRLIAKGATKAAGGSVPFLGQALLAADLIATTATIYQQRKWETQAEANDAFNTIYAEQKKELAKKYGVEDIDRDILQNDKISATQKEDIEQELRNIRIAANKPIQELKDKNMLHAIGDIAQTYLARAAVFGNLDNIFKGSKYLKAVQKIGAFGATVNAEANEEIAQALYQKIAFEKAVKPKSQWQFAKLEEGDDTFSNLKEYVNDRWYAEKALGRYGDESFYNDPTVRNAASGSYWVTGLMAGLPAMFHVGSRAISYNSLKATLSKAAEINGDVDGMLFSQKIYQNILAGGKADQYKNIIKDFAKNELFGLDAKKVERELSRFEKAEKAYDSLKGGMFTKHITSKYYDQVNHIDKIDAVSKALVVGEIDEKIAELTQARGAHFDKYGFLTSTNPSLTKLLEDDPELRTIDTQLKMYQEKKQNLLDEIDEISTGWGTANRVKIENEYKKADETGKRKLEYIHGDKLSNLNNAIRHEGEKSYIKNFINFYEKFQKESHDDKRAMFRKLIDSNKSIESIINFAIASGVKISDSEYENLHRKLNVDTDEKRMEQIKAFKASDGSQLFSDSLLNEYQNFLDNNKRLDKDALDQKFYEYLDKTTSDVDDLMALHDSYNNSTTDPNSINRSNLEKSKNDITTPFTPEYKTEKEKEVEFLNDKYVTNTPDEIHNAINNVEYSDLNSLTQHAAKIEKLKKVFSEVHPDNTDGIAYLDKLLSDLKDAAVTVKKRLADKQTIQTISKENHIKNIFSFLGISVIDDNNVDLLLTVDGDPLYDIISDLLGKDTFDNIVNKITEEIKKGGTLNSLHAEALINTIKESLNSEQLKRFNEVLELGKLDSSQRVLKSVDSLSEEGDDQFFSPTIAASYRTKLEEAKVAYMENPSRNIINLLYFKMVNRVAANELLQDLVKSQDFYKFLYKLDTLPFSEEDKDWLNHMISNHLRVIAAEEIKNQIEGTYNPKVESQLEVAEIEKLDTTIFPVEQQFITIRQIVKFLLNKNKETDFKKSAIYFQGVAGAGKTSLVLRLILKLAGIDIKKSYFLGATKATTNVLRKYMGVAETIEDDVITEFLNTPNADLADKELIVFDEALIKSLDTLETTVLEKIKTVNELRRTKGLNNLKVIISGDPVQITENFIPPFFLGNSRNGLTPWQDVVMANALTISYRTDDNDILLLQNTFKGKSKEVDSINCSRTSNFEQGTYASSKLEDIYEVLKTRNSTEPALIIVDTDAKKAQVEQNLKDLGLLSKVKEVVLVRDSQGRTEESVYVSIDKINEVPSNQKTLHTMYNACMYVATGRGKNFVMVVTNDLSFTNSTKDIISTVDSTKEKNDKKVSKLVDLQRTSTFINSDIFGKKAVVPVTPITPVANEEFDDTKEDLSNEPIIDEETIEDNETEQNTEEPVNTVPPVIISDDSSIIMSEHVLAHPETGPASLSLNEGDEVSYVRHAGPKDINGNPTYTFFILKKIADVEDTYALVGMIGEDEFNNLPAVFKNEAYSTNGNFTYNLYDSVKNLKALAPTQAASVNSSTVFKGFIKKLTRRFFNYTNNYTKLSDFMKGKIDKIVEDYLNKANISKFDINPTITYNIIVAKNSDKTKDKKMPTAGHSYLKVNFTYTTKSGKTDNQVFWINLVPRKLNKTKDADIFEPLNKLTDIVEKLQSLTGIIYGSMTPSKYEVFSKIHGKNMPLSNAEAFHKMLGDNIITQQIKSELKDVAKIAAFDTLRKELRDLVYGKNELRFDDTLEDKGIESFTTWSKENLITGKKGSRRIVPEEEGERDYESHERDGLSHHPKDNTYVKVYKEIWKNGAVTVNIVWRKVFEHHGVHVKLDYDPETKEVVIDLFDGKDVEKNGRLYVNSEKDKDGNIQKKNRIASYHDKVSATDFSSAISEVQAIEESYINKITDNDVFKSDVKGEAQIALDKIAKSNYKIFVNGKPVIFRQNRKIKRNKSIVTVVTAKGLLATKDSSYTSNRNVIVNGKKEKQTVEDIVPPITWELLKALTDTDAEGNSQANPSIANPGTSFGLRRSIEFEEVNGSDIKYSYEHNTKDSDKLENNERILDLYEINLESIDNATTTIGDIHRPSEQKDSEKYGTVPDNSTSNVETETVNTEDDVEYVDPFNVPLTNTEEDEEQDLRYDTTSNLGNKKLSRTGIINYLKKIMPDITEDSLKILTEELWKRQFDGKLGYGKHVKGMIYLLQNNDGTINENVVKHEAFHRVFHKYLTKQEQEALLKYAKKMYPAETRNSFLEENLAVLFQEFTIIPNKFVGLVYKAFNRLKYILGYITKNQMLIEDIFIDINNGNFSKDILNNVNDLKSEEDFSKIISHFTNERYSTSEVYEFALNSVLERLYYFNNNQNHKGEVIPVTFSSNSKTGKDSVNNVPLTIEEQKIQFIYEIRNRLFNIDKELSENKSFIELYNKLISNEITLKKFISSLDTKSKNLFKEKTVKSLLLEKKRGETGLDIIFDSIYRTATIDEEKAVEEIPEDIKALNNLNMNDEIQESEAKNHYAGLTAIVSNVLSTIPVTIDGVRKFISPTFAFNTALELMKYVSSDLKDFERELREAVTKASTSVYFDAVKNKLISILEKANTEYYTTLDGKSKQLPRDYELVYSKNTLVFKDTNNNLAPNTARIIAFPHGEPKDYHSNTNKFYNLIKDYLIKNHGYKESDKAEIYNMINAMHQVAIANDQINAIFTRLSSLYKRDPQIIKIENGEDLYGQPIRQIKTVGLRASVRGYETAIKENLKERIKELTTTIVYDKELKNKVKDILYGNKKVTFESYLNSLLEILKLDKGILTGTIPLVRKDKNGNTVPSTTGEAVRNKLVEIIQEIDNFKNEKNNVEDVFSTIVNKNIETLQDIFTKTTDYNFANSYITGDGKKVYMYINANYAIRLVKQLINKTLHRHESDVYTANRFFSNNLFIRSVNKDETSNTIHRFINHDSIVTEDYRGNEVATMYANETFIHRFVRMFSVGFVDSIKYNIQRDQKMQYFQYGYTTSDRPNVVGYKINVLTMAETLDAIGLIWEQEKDRANRLKESKNNINPAINKGYGREVVFNHKNTFVPGLDATKVSKETYIAQALTYIQNESLSKELEKIHKIDNFYTIEAIKQFEKLVEKKFINPAYTTKIAELQEQLEGLTEPNERNIIDKEINKIKLEGVFSVYYLQNYVNGHHLNQIFQGDVGQYKGSDDQIKRAAMPYSPGFLGRVDPKRGMNKKFGVLVAKDVTSKISEVRDVLSKFASLHGKKFDRDDAFCLCTPARMREIRKGFGSDFGMRNIAKPVFHGFDDFGYAVGLKYSMAELTNELVAKFPELAKIRETLEELEKETKVNFELHFPSSFKYGVPLNLVDLNSDVTVTQQLNQHLEKDNSVPIVILDNSNYQIQSNPFHEEGKVHVFTQFEYFLDTNTLNPELSDMVYQINAKLMDIGANKLFKSIGLQLDENKNPIQVDESKLRKVLLDALKNGNGNESYITILEAKDADGKYLISLNYPGVQEKLVITLSSQFSNKIIDLRASGNKLVLQPNLGVQLFEVSGELMYANQLPANLQAQAEEFYKLTSPEREYLMQKKNSYDLDTTKEHWKKASSLLAKELELDEAAVEKLEAYNKIVPQKLKYYTGEKNGEKFAEVIAPNSWKKYGVKTGDILYNSMIGIRIPTTGIHSAIPFKIVGWSDANSNTIIAPEEIVPLHGSDYDVDSLMVMRNEAAEDTVNVLDKNGEYRTLYNKGDIIGFNNYKEDGTKITNMQDVFDSQPVVKNNKGEYYFEVFLEHLDAIEHTIKELNKKLSILEKGTGDYKSVNKEIKFLSNLIPHLYNNMKLHSYMRIITDDKNAKEMGTPISLDKLTGDKEQSDFFSGKIDYEKLDIVNPVGFIKVLKECFEKAGIEFTLDNIKSNIKIEKAANRLTVSDILAKVMLSHNEIAPQTILKIAKKQLDIKSTKNLNSFFDQSEYHYLNFSGKKLVATFASMAKGYAYLWKGRNENTLPTSPVDLTINGEVYNTLGTNEKTNSSIFGGEMNSVWELFDTLINLAVDNVKEQKLDLINATENTGQMIGYLVAVCSRFVDTSLIMNNKVIQEVLDKILWSGVKTGRAYTLTMNELRAEANSRNLDLKELDKNTLTTEGLFTALQNNSSFKDASLEDFKIYYTVAKNLVNIQEKVIEKMRSYSSAVSLIQDFKVTYEEIEKSQKDAEVASNPETLPFKNTSPFEIPHLAKAKEVHDILYKTFPLFLKMLHSKINTFLFDTLPTEGVRLAPLSSYEGTSERQELRKEFSKYLMSSIFTDADAKWLQEEVEIINSTGEKVTIVGLEAWIHKFSESVKSLKNTIKNNQFLDMLIVKKNKKGVSMVDWHLGTNKGGPLDIKLMDEFLKLSLDNGEFGPIQENMVKYGALIYGDKFAIKSFALYMPPKLLANNANQYADNLNFLLLYENKFENIMAHFLLKYAITHPKKIVHFSELGRAFVDRKEALALGLLGEHQSLISVIAKKEKSNKQLLKDLDKENKEYYESLQTDEEKEQFIENLDNTGKSKKMPLVVAGYNDSLQKDTIWVRIDENDSYAWYRSVGFENKAPAYYLTKDVVTNGIKNNVLFDKDASIINMSQKEYSKKSFNYTFEKKRSHSFVPNVGQKVYIKLHSDDTGEQAKAFIVTKKNIKEEMLNGKPVYTIDASFERAGGKIQDNIVNIKDINNIDSVC